MMTKIQLKLTSTYCQGWPRARIRHGNTCHDIQVKEYADIELEVVADELVIERYGKQPHNVEFDRDTVLKDQILKIDSIQVNGVDVPEYVLQNHSQFRFDDQVHQGSRYFGPNGVWRFQFQLPLVTWLLDQKIQHEAKYNQDYQYDWSYQLGPESVKMIQADIVRVRQILDSIDI